jgi:hypothetical protein
MPEQMNEGQSPQQSYLGAHQYIHNETDEHEGYQGQFIVEKMVIQTP